MSKQTQMNANQNRENKRAQFATPTKKKGGWSWVVILAIAAIVGLGAYLVIAGSGNKPASSTVTSTGQSTTPQSTGGSDADEIKIPLADLASGKAKFFDYSLSTKTPVRFFAVKSSDGGYRAAMDACEVCFHAKKGYQQDGDDMVCNNCGKRFAISRIGEIQGGCHPIGVPRAVEGDSLVVKASELESRGRYFQ